MKVFEESRAYKPFFYPKAYEFYKRQNQCHWMPEEVPLTDDVKDWKKNLTDEERSFLSQIFRFFTQADVDVGANYMQNYMPLFKNNEVRMMMAAFSAMECIHIDAYSQLIETVGMPESEYSAFREHAAMRAKHDYLQQFDLSAETSTIDDVLTSIAVFGAFTEGLQLFASFAMLMNFPRFNKMKGMGQIVTWSVRDESLHCEGMIWLFKTLMQEAGDCVEKQRLSDRIYDAANTMVELEFDFIDSAFELGGIQGLEAEDVNQYVRFVCDWRLRQLGYGPIFSVDKHPLPWLVEIMNGVEHANFFEARATEYARGSTAGTWEDAF